LYGWMQIFIANTGSQASLAVALAGFLNVLTGGSFNTTYFSFNVLSYAIPFGTLQIIALLSIAVLTLVNCAAVVVSGYVATVLTVVKIALVLLIGVGAFLASDGGWDNFALANVGGACEGVSDAARYGIAGFGAAMLGALWGYDGWNNLTLVAGEVKNPQRNIPLALIGGMLVIITLYVFINIAYFYVLTPTEVANIPAPPQSTVATEAAKQFLGPVAVSLIAAALLASSVGSLHTSILTGARVPYAMSRDGMLIPSLSRLSKSTRVPVGALIMQGSWAGVLTLSGSFDTLTNYVVFGSWIFYGLTTASVFLFRRRMPHAERPYKAWGYPVVPILFLLVTAFLLINTLLTTPVQALIGLGLIALGLPVYWYFSKRGLVNISQESPYGN
ncbi:MAG: APC family permease, partial [Pyrinomonadaceae bacterium]